MSTENNKESARCRARAPLLGISLALAFAAGCAPAFQDARMAGRGHFELTPSLSGLGASDDGETDYVAHTFGVQGQVGVHHRMDIGAAYARLEDENFEAGVNAIGFGPKFGIIRDRFAVSVPFSFFFGNEVPTSDTWLMQPTALLTLPMSERVDFNPSARVVIGLCENCDTLVGFNAGFGLRPRPSLTIRPEAGFLFNPGESGVLWSFGVGISLRDR